LATSVCSGAQPPTDTSSFKLVTHELLVLSTTTLTHCHSVAGPYVSSNCLRRVGHVCTYVLLVRPLLHHMPLVTSDQTPPYGMQGLALSKQQHSSCRTAISSLKNMCLGCQASATGGHWGCGCR
jgi:hypothetical protein